MDIWLPRYGFPLFLHSDQGKEFDNAMIHKLSELLGTVKTKTTPYHPLSDGLVERFNRTLLAMFAMFVSQEHDNWDDLLPFMMTPLSTRPPDSRHTDSSLVMNATYQETWSTESCAQTHHQEIQALTLLGYNTPYTNHMMRCARSNKEPRTVRNATTIVRRWRAHSPLDAGHFVTIPQPERINYVHHGLDHIR